MFCWSKVLIFFTLICPGSLAKKSGDGLTDALETISIWHDSPT